MHRRISSSHTTFPPDFNRSPNHGQISSDLRSAMINLNSIRASREVVPSVLATLPNPAVKTDPVAVDLTLESSDEDDLESITESKVPGINPKPKNFPDVGPESGTLVQAILHSTRTIASFKDPSQLRLLCEMVSIPVSADTKLSQASGKEAILFDAPAKSIERVPVFDAGLTASAIDSHSFVSKSRALSAVNIGPSDIETSNEVFNNHALLSSNGFTPLFPLVSGTISSDIYIDMQIVDTSPPRSDTAVKPPSLSSDGLHNELVVSAIAITGNTDTSPFNKQALLSADKFAISGSLPKLPDAKTKTCEIDTKIVNTHLIPSNNGVRASSTSLNSADNQVKDYGMDLKSPSRELVSPSLELPLPLDLPSTLKIEEKKSVPTPSGNAPGSVPLPESLLGKRPHSQISNDNATPARTSVGSSLSPRETPKSQKKLRQSLLSDYPLLMTLRSPVVPVSPLPKLQSRSSPKIVESHKKAQNTQITDPSKFATSLVLSTVLAVSSPNTPNSQKKLVVSQLLSSIQLPVVKTSTSPPSTRPGEISTPTNSNKKLPLSPLSSDIQPPPTTTSTSPSTLLTAMSTPPKSFKNPRPSWPFSVTTILNNSPPKVLPSIEIDEPATPPVIDKKYSPVAQPVRTNKPDELSPPRPEIPRPQPPRVRKLKHPRSDWITLLEAKQSQPASQVAEPIDARRIMSRASQRKRMGKRTTAKQPLLLPKNRAQYFRHQPKDVYDPLEPTTKVRVYGKGDLAMRDYTIIAPAQSSHGLPNYGGFGYSAQPYPPAAEPVYDYKYGPVSDFPQRKAYDQTYIDHSLSTNDILRFDQQHQRWDAQYQAAVESALKPDPEEEVQLPFNEHLRTCSRDASQALSITAGTNGQLNGLGLVGRPNEASVSPVSGKKEKPSFLKPLCNMTTIFLGDNVFSIYSDFLEYYCPKLAATCRGSTLHRPAKPAELHDVDLDVFGLFIQWLYSQTVVNKKGEPAFQHRLMQLWVLGERLGMKGMMNDVIDGIQARRTAMEEEIQTKTFNYIYTHTAKRAMLRKYLVGVCAPIMDSFKTKAKNTFPVQMLDEIAEWKGKGAGDTDMGMDMEKYHVALD